MTTATVHDKRRYTGSSPGRRTIGTGIVILLHILIAWALITGTARKGLEIIKKPLEAAVIQEVIIPPPPPPPPPKKIEQPKQIEQPKAPPPPFVPPPEVTPPTTTAPVIESVQAPPPSPPVIAPPIPAAPVGPVRGEMGVVCPTQVKPEMPRQALRDGIEGDVTAQATIRNGQVVEVQILSGPRVYHNAVRSAMQQYKCVSGPGDVIATQVFGFKIQ